MTVIGGPGSRPEDTKMPRAEGALPGIRDRIDVMEEAWNAESELETWKGLAGCLRSTEGPRD